MRHKPYPKSNILSCFPLDVVYFIMSLTSNALHLWDKTLSFSLSKHLIFSWSIFKCSMNIWMQAVFLATLAATFSLRNAGFTYSREENSYLTSDSPHLQDRQGLSSLHCAQLCAKNPSCKAANYDDSTSQCELLASKEGATAVQNGATLMRQFFIGKILVQMHQLIQECNCWFVNPKVIAESYKYIWLAPRLSTLKVIAES